jgi:hypothetical protein
MGIRGWLEAAACDTVHAVSSVAIVPPEPGMAMTK